MVLNFVIHDQNTFLHPTEHVLERPRALGRHKVPDPLSLAARGRVGALSQARSRRL